MGIVALGAEAAFSNCLCCYDAGGDDDYYHDDDDHAAEISAECPAALQVKTIGYDDHERFGS